ncbi:unnamed protein product [Lymnaea stagnalis]|uniref:Protein-lysine N-methyltransferase SMYD4 n=1 Tax=Lymnaea stagnalis TaxID=6523 RepID=A0AAV2INX9_LYMST
MAAPLDFGNWQKSIDTLLQTIKPDHLKAFNLLQTNKERVKFIFKHRLLNYVEWLPAYFEACKSWHGKSKEVAQVWRNKGNKLFQLKKYIEAIEAYTESCLNSHPDNGDDLPLSFGNRSAAFFHLALYKDCLLDIKRAEQNRFPVESLHKLLARKTSAHLKLGHKQEAEKSFQALKEFVNGKQFCLQGSKKDEFLKEVSSIGNSLFNIHDVSHDPAQEDKNVPSLFAGTNSLICQASKAVSFTVTLDKGRHLLANESIPKGSTIIVECPFAAVLLPDHYKTHCHHCFTPLKFSAIGCDQCNVVRFCDEFCKETAWSTYHRTECRYLDLFHSVGIAHLSFRIILCTTLEFLIDFVRNQLKYRLSDDWKTKGLNKDGMYDRSYVSVYDLMTHEDSTEPQDMLQYSLTAGLLLVTLIHGQFFDKPDCAGDGRPVSDSLMDFVLGGHLTKERRCQVFPEAQRKICWEVAVGNGTLSTEGKNIHSVPLHLLVSGMEDLKPEMKDIGDLLLRHILQLVCNAHAITSVQTEGENELPESTVDISQVRIATAIYPTASLMNHSCDPTIISSFIGDILVVKTVMDVNKGEEIYNCYGPHHCRMRREERQEILRSQYHFDCCCPPCCDGDVSNERFGALKCTYCAGILTEKNCKVCGQSIDEQTLTALRGLVGQTGKLFARGIQLMTSQEWEGAITVFKECQKQRKEFLYKDHRDLAIVDDALARCFASIGDYSTSADHLFSSIKFAEQMYGDKSVEYSHELQKLAEVLFNAERFRECLPLAEQCLGLFTSLYTPEHEAVKQITEVRDAAQFALAPMMQSNAQK